MAATYVIERLCPQTQTRDLAFAGDGVRLAGHIDYPSNPMPMGRGYPLLFLLHHAGGCSRRDYAHYIHAGHQAGYAVFTWDKRGTGRSGASGRGSVTQDAVNAYETAVEQPDIDRNRVVILAQGEGTMLLGDAFGLFARIVRPAGVVLVSSMLDAERVLAINAPLHIVQGGQDWRTPEVYARKAAEHHAHAYTYTPSFYVAEQADRLLTIGGNFDLGAVHTIQDWLAAR
jgi:pimeloyl-ACP methyl ester carboxylesterase